MAKSTNKPHGDNGDDKQNKNDENERNDDFSVKHRFGTVDATAFEVTPRQMYFGNGNSPDNYNVTDVAALHLETGLKIHVRTGADIPPTGAQAGDGTEYYVAPAGLQPGSPLPRAAWNFDYVVDTAVGSIPITTQNTLGDFTFKMGISQSGPFLPTKTVVYDLNAATHLWISETNPTHGFGGDDFTHAASPTLQSHLAENSVNLGFLISDFGPLATSTAAGVSYDIKLSAYHGDDLISMTHDVILLA